MHRAQPHHDEAGPDGGVGGGAGGATAPPVAGPPPGVVCAFAPHGPERGPVVAWATRHAHRVGAALELLVDPGDDVREPDHHRPGLLEAVVGVLRGAVLGRGHGTLANRLSSATAGAGLLVVPQRLPGLEEVVAAAYETVAVIPGEEPRRDRGGPVVVASAPWTGEEVLAAGFAAAQERRTALVLLRVPSRDRLRVLPSDDTERERELRDGEDLLSVWRLTHPEVPAEVRLADRDPGDVLEELSDDARLLVLGRSARGRLLETLAASPVGRVARRARCPVLVVPTAGPPRRPWWPTGGHGPRR